MTKEIENKKNVKNDDTVNRAFKYGFTLIELLLVLAIIGIMTALLFVNMAKTGVQNELKTAGRQLASGLREAQTYALTGKQKGPDEYPCAFKFSVKDDGDGEEQYNIHYISRGISEKCNDTSVPYAPGEDDDWELFAGPIMFNKIEDVSGDPVIFTVPHAEYVNNLGDLGLEADVTEFTVGKKGKSYVVKIHPNGQIDDTGMASEE